MNIGYFILLIIITIRSHCGSSNRTIVSKASMRKRPSSNSQTSLLNQALTSGTVSQRAENSDELEKTSTAHADKLMDELLALGYYPKARGADQPFQLRLSRAEKRGEFSTSQMETIEALKAQAAKKDEKSSQTGETSTKRADDIMDEIRSLGYYPRESGADINLARRRRDAERNGEFSTSQKEELHGPTRLILS